MDRDPLEDSGNKQNSGIYSQHNRRGKAVFVQPQDRPGEGAQDEATGKCQRTPGARGALRFIHQATSSKKGGPEHCERHNEQNGRVPLPRGRFLRRDGRGQGKAACPACYERRLSRKGTHIQIDEQTSFADEVVGISKPAPNNRDGPIRQQKITPEEKQSGEHRPQQPEEGKSAHRRADFIV